MEDSLIVVVLTLVVSLIAQPVLLRLARRGTVGDRFWLFVDYVWTGLAIFALLFAVSELERLQAKYEADTKRLEVTAEWRDILGSATFNRDILNGSGAHAPAAGWFKYLVSVLELGYTNFKWQWFLGQNEDLWRPRQLPNESRVPQWSAVDFARLDPKDPSSEEARDILLRLNDFQATYRDLERADARASQLNMGPGKRLLFALVFPLVFALRIGKTTVEWHGRNQRAPTAQQSNWVESDKVLAVTDSVNQASDQPRSNTA